MFTFIHIPPNHKGVIYRNNRLFKTADPMRLVLFSVFADYKVALIPTVPQIVLITNQEILTSDNIALRFSYYIRYKVTDIRKFSEEFDLFRVDTLYRKQVPMSSAEEFLHVTSQVFIRENIITRTAEALNTQRKSILEEAQAAFKERVKEVGIEILTLEIRDITFPKNIQDIFSHKLESQIRAQADLENARTQVATARTLQNAAQMIKEHPEIKYLNWLETVNKLASKGNHTFVLNPDVENGILRHPPKG